jgi:threonine dehydrogenase-like Zn-dependent dehydrogenase
MCDCIVLPAAQMCRCDKLPNEMIPLVETLGVGIQAAGRGAVQSRGRAIVVGSGPIGLEFATRRYGLRRYYPSHAEARQEPASMLVFDCTGDRDSMESSIDLLEQGGN